ncbi:MAG: ThuA domain-containing protein [Abitibacteriaceae bacterium]|nr:ThuA domain-containing protein [Abditibacteriaceae bacterium]MBV9868672.1 ThuA domain-containing protein [Abditibacteriaceae bacterium]
MKTTLATLLALSLTTISYPSLTQTAPPTGAIKPLKVLLITGGCCHDYKKQKDILKEGLEKRANLIVDQVHTDDGSTKPPLAILNHPDYAKGYNVVIHDECGADISDPATVEGVLKPHRDGIPAVNLHCAMHSYRIGDPNTPVDPIQPGTPHSLWFEYLGLQSAHHGAQKPIAISFFGTTNPITKGMENWTTIGEELYNNVTVWPDTTPLALGRQDAGDKRGENNNVVVWTHLYGPKKTRVFSTTIGHNNETVSDDRYLSLVTRGLLWACDKLNDDGTPKTGYGPGGK